MKRNQSSPVGGVDRFRTTRWSMVLLAAQSQASSSKEALGELCNLYWYPLYGFVRQCGHSPEDTRDLTQGFFLNLFEHRALTRLDRQKGKFRSFLLASVQKYLSNETRQTIGDAIDARRRITRERLQKVPTGASRVETRKPQARVGPKKISVARLPVTGSDVFGREEDIAFLDDAWGNKEINIVTIIAWAGVGKSTLINHWLRRMATDHYRSAELIFGWSFYNQGTNKDTSSPDEFLETALNWFGDRDPRLGTAWEKGERLAKLVAHRRTLLVLDGLEPLQNPPGSQEGRLREPSLQALLRELAAFNGGGFA